MKLESLQTKTLKMGNQVLIKAEVSKLQALKCGCLLCRSLCHCRPFVGYVFVLFKNTQWGTRLLFDTTWYSERYCFEYLFDKCSCSVVKKVVLCIKVWISSFQSARDRTGWQSSSEQHIFSMTIHNPSCLQMLASVFSVGSSMVTETDINPWSGRSGVDEQKLWALNLILTESQKSADIHSQYVCVITIIIYMIWDCTKCHHCVHVFEQFLM